MKLNKVLVSLLSAGVLVSPMAYATNGDEMMAVGSQSTALGGTGVANYMGADSVWANPGMLGKSKGSEVTGGVVAFTPKVSNTGMPGGSAADSGANPSYIPDVSFSSRINDNMSYGVAMAGIAGMGVDYTAATASTHIRAKSDLSILRVMPTLAYNGTGYGVGMSPIFQSGALRLSYVSSTTVNGTGKYESSTGYGYSVGGYFDVMPTLTVAASYQSEIAAKYGTQLYDAGVGFNLTGASAFGNDLNQPAVTKAGIAYTVADSITLTADYKLIQWGQAKGYKDFNWKDQTVAAIGVKYAGSGYWLGLGYNSANDPISSLPAASGAAAEYKNAAVNFFNNMFFPAIVTNSMTFGGGYDISKEFAVEVAAVVTPEVTKKVDVMNFGGTNTTKHSQSSYSASLRYKF
ncbi:MAG: outer membrane protein transport protein [Gallionellaceae bacterium]|nr:outer membrane protein transport protein [Gallionellaceae bacterium]